MNAQYYDLNVYGFDRNLLSLSAYEWELAPDGLIQQNSSKYHTITFRFPEEVEEIEFLLDDLAVNEYPFTDYDEWRNLEELYTSKAPQRIKQFLEELPMYDVPIVGVING